MRILFGNVMSKKRMLNITVLAALAFFFWLMLLICIQYVPINFDVAFLRIKQTEIQHPHYQVAFFTHVYTSLFTLLAGLTQFSSLFRKKFTLAHRSIGKIYIYLILLLAGPSGMVLAYYAKGGFWSQLSFILLSCLWMLFTFLALRKTIQKKFETHKKFMYFSYALTLSAITLRLWKYIIANTIALPPHETYIIVSWLAWTLNLVVAYFLFKSQNEIKNIG